MKRTFKKFSSQGPHSSSSRSYRKARRISIPRPFGSNQQMLIGKSTLTEIKCRDQMFTPGAQIALVTTANVAYVAPTIAGLGLATGFSCINTLQQGNGVAQRIGDKVVFRSITVNGCICCADDNTIVDQGHIRVMVVYDKQTNGATPLIGDIIANVNSDNSYNVAFNSSIRIANRKRFVCLKNKIYNMGYTDNASIHFKYYIKKNLETTYSGSSDPPTLAQVMNGAIYLLIFTSVGFTHPPLINDINCRLRYSD